MAEKEYIEREAAFNAILKLVPKVDDDGYCWVIRGDAATAIDEIPAADVRPVVRGKWKPSMCGTANGPIQDRDEWYGPLFLCSECGADMIGASNFCPNCGADMREES